MSDGVPSHFRSRVHKEYKYGNVAVACVGIQCVGYSKELLDVLLVDYHPKDMSQEDPSTSRDRNDDRRDSASGGPAALNIDADEPSSSNPVTIAASEKSRRNGSKRKHVAEETDAGTLRAKSKSKNKRSEGGMSTAVGNTNMNGVNKANANDNKGKGKRRKKKFQLRRKASA